jgi:hypothetical protein
MAPLPLEPAPEEGEGESSTHNATCQLLEQTGFLVLDAADSGGRPLAVMRPRAAREAAPDELRLEACRLESCPVLEVCFENACRRALHGASTRRGVRAPAPEQQVGANQHIHT